ncbi:MAG: RagB/SusD family nutrient uptake outer membrane protein [Bacteroidetes bacterium]|nr:RagB/SusD family nutrient uptake outer membrane protein [Bacteroidota bacterium]
MGQPAGKITADEVFSDSSLLQQALLNLDLTLGYYEGNFTPFVGMYTDELGTSRTISYYTDFYNNNLQATNATCANIWRYLYSAIYQSNAMLEGLPGAKNIPASLAQRARGEAEFIRAYSYFYLVNIFGDVPLVLSTDVGKSSLAYRTNMDSIYAHVVTDLEDAKSVLLDSYPGEEKVRPCKWAASALLARTWLYLQDWKDAEQESASVISSGQFSLQADLSQVFLKNNGEAIYQIWNANGYTTLSGLIPSSSFSAPVYFLRDSLYGSFEDGDGRKTAWVINDTISGYPYHCFYKYKQVRKPASDADAEYISLLRLSEQYLIRAEAEAEQDELNAAITDINTIRMRAGLPGLNPTLNKDEVLAALQQERRVEFFAENGHRFFDLKRWGMIDQVLAQTKPNWQKDDELFPIPQGELNDDPNLVQNPGYH